MRKNSQHSQNSEEHLHLHYHYYYPSELRGSSKDNRDRKSESFKHESHKDIGYATPKQKTGSRIRTEGDDFPMTEMKKMRLSDLCKIREYSGTSQPQEKSEIKAKSVVQEVFQQFESESEFIGTNSFMQKSVNTALESESTHKLMSYYQAELSHYKSEIERLKMVEEECKYLRDAFYSHYTEECPNHKL